MIMLNDGTILKLDAKVGSIYEIDYPEEYDFKNVETYDRVCDELDIIEHAGNVFDNNIKELVSKYFNRLKYVVKVL